MERSENLLCIQPRDDCSLHCGITACDANLLDANLNFVRLIGRKNFE
jgi:hypothetical protein